MSSLVSLAEGRFVFGSRIPLKLLSIVCRSLSTMLHSGVAVGKAFDLAADKAGNPRCRGVFRDIGEDLRSGSDVSSALAMRGKYFPPLMIDMVSVAEQTGTLPEVLGSLADHYENNVRLRKNFVSAIAWPVFQFTAAVFVIALLILILGLIAEGNNNAPIDILGFGLSGPAGAITWLALVFGTVGGVFAAYKLSAHFLGGKNFVDPLLMRIPVLGTAMRSFAIARFSWAFYLTQQSGMPIRQSLTASLRATSNGAFMAATPMICDAVESGEDLAAAFEMSELFPEDFNHMVHVAETSGTVPEALQRLSPQFEDQARRSLSALATAVGWLVWLVVAGFIIFFVFRIIFWYLALLQDAMKGI